MGLETLVWNLRYDPTQHRIGISTPEVICAIFDFTMNIFPSTEKEIQGYIFCIPIIPRPLKKFFRAHNP